MLPDTWPVSGSVKLLSLHQDPLTSILAQGQVHEESQIKGYYWPYPHYAHFPCLEYVRSVSTVEHDSSLSLGFFFLCLFDVSCFNGLDLFHVGLIYQILRAVPCYFCYLPSGYQCVSERTLKLCNRGSNKNSHATFILGYI